MRIGSRGMTADDRYRYLAYRQSEASKKLCRVLGVTVAMSHPVALGKGSLVVSNHVGILDPWILASQMNVAFAAKAEMDRWPVFGWIGRSVQLIYVYRSRRMETESFVDAVQKRMRCGVGVLVFPEGTTSDGCELLPFKTGGFEAVAGMADGYVHPLYFWAEQINGVPTDANTRRQITWPEGQRMLANAWQVLGLQTIVIRIVVSDPIATRDRDRKELAVASQHAVEAMHRASRSTGKNNPDT